MYPVVSHCWDTHGPLSEFGMSLSMEGFSQSLLARRRPDMESLPAHRSIPLLLMKARLDSLRAVSRKEYGLIVLCKPPSRPGSTKKVATLNIAECMPVATRKSPRPPRKRPCVTNTPEGVEDGLREGTWTLGTQS